MAALVIHPNTPGELREKLKKDLRRRHVTINEIRRTMDEGRVGVVYRKEVRGSSAERHAIRRTGRSAALARQGSRTPDRSDEESDQEADREGQEEGGQEGGEEGEAETLGGTDGSRTHVRQKSNQHRLRA